MKSAFSKWWEEYLVQKGWIKYCYPLYALLNCYLQSKNSLNVQFKQSFIAAIGNANNLI